MAVGLSQAGVLVLIFCSYFEAVLGSVDVGDLGDLFSTIGGLSEILGSGEDCEFTCPNGKNIFFIFLRVVVSFSIDP